MKKTTKKKTSSKSTKSKTVQKTIMRKVELLDHKEVKHTKDNVMVDVKNIKKHYGTKEVLHGIDLKIYEGERLAIIGPNGAGKSTLTEIIAGVKEASSGEISYSFGKHKGEISKNIGIQFQESVYHQFFKVSSIVEFFIDVAGLEISKERLDELLKLFKLEDFYNAYATGLSGGQKQRLNILLAVIHQPKLLILDEVGTGLDVETRTNVKKFIREYLDRTNSTSIIVSHNSDEVLSLADRIVVIYDGKIYEDRRLKDILKEYGSFDEYTDYLFFEKFKQASKPTEKKVEDKKKKKFSFFKKDKTTTKKEGAK